MIDTEALRKKIIDLAIQGKLTEQLPEDGDAESLYAQIQEEKAKLIKEGKIKKEKPLPPISAEEIPFEIPRNWKWYRLGEVYNILMGQSPKGMNVGKDIDGIEFHQGKIYFGDKYLNPSEQKTSEKTRIANKNAVLLCVRAPVGVVNITERQICIGRGLCALEAVVGMNPYYLFYYLLTCRKSFENSGTGSTFSAITVDVVKKHLIPLPPLAEQKRIVEQLDAVLEQIDIIDTLQQQYESDLSVLKGKIIDAGIRGKLTEQLPEDGDAETLYSQIQEEKAKLIKEGKIKKEKPLPEISADEIPFEIPKNWKWVRLGELIKINSGTGLTSYQMGKGDIPVYGGNGITGYHNKSLVKEETIVIGRVGFYCGSVHVTPAKAWITDNAFITQYPKKYIDRDFLVYVLKHMDLRQNTNGAAQPVVSGKKIYPLLVPLPPLAEQRRISQKIDNVVSVIEEL